MTRKPLLVLMTSLLLLPASCACGIVAQDMKAGRQGLEVRFTGPLWVENLLWTGALALMLVWARRVGKIYRTEPTAKEAGE